MKHLFTYGSLRRAQYNHSVLERVGAKFVGEASINANMVPTRYPFPAIEEGNGTVSGEVYEVSSEGFLSLDSFEGAPHFYQRRSTVTDTGIPVEVYYGTGVIDKKPLSSPPSVAPGSGTD